MLHNMNDLQFRRNVTLKMWPLLDFSHILYFLRFIKYKCEGVRYGYEIAKIDFLKCDSSPKQTGCLNGRTGSLLV